MNESRSVGKRGARGSRGVWILEIVLLAWTFVGCEDRETVTCGNQMPITFHRVMDREACADCTEYSIRSPITAVQELYVRSDPDWIVEPCSVREIEVWLDGVGLTLEQGAYDGLADLKRRLTKSEGPDALVALFLEGQGEPVSVLHVGDLGLYMLMLGFESPDRVWQFVGELGLEGSRITETRTRVIEGRAQADSVTVGASDLVTELEARTTDLEELARRVEAEGGMFPSTRERRESTGE